MQRSLDERTLDLYLLDLDPVAGDEDVLADVELARAVRLARPDARRRFVAARAALRRVLAGYLGVEAGDVAFAYGEHGKPRLAAAGAAGDAGDATGIAFNVSHCGDVGLVVVASAVAVGVDVERVRADLSWEGIARRFFCDAERRVLDAVPAGERLATFFRLWTVREAYLKARGVGLDSPSAPLPVLAPGDPRDASGDEAQAWRKLELACVPGCAASVVWRGPSLSLRRVEAPAGLRRS